MPRLSSPEWISCHSTKLCVISYAVKHIHETTEGVIWSLVWVTVRMLMIPSFLVHLNVAYLKMDWERENKLKLNTDKMEVLTVRGKNEFGTEVKFAQNWVAFSQNTIAIMPNVTT